MNNYVINYQLLVLQQQFYIKIKIFLNQLILLIQEQNHR